jgi:hypothetical protein
MHKIISGYRVEGSGMCERHCTSSRWITELVTSVTGLQPPDFHYEGTGKILFMNARFTHVRG